MENNDYSYSIMSTVDSDVMHREGVGGVIRISTDGHDQKIWGGVEIFFARIFLGRKIWQVFCGWLVLSRQIHDFVTTVMASPGNHLVKNHESQSRTI